MVDSYILTFLEKHLGKADGPSKGNLLFYCPFCHHRKKKLSIQLDSDFDTFEFWHCWVCNESGEKIKNLLKKVKINEDVIKEVQKYINEEVLKCSVDIADEYSARLTLPKEFISLCKKGTTPDYKNAIFYLKKRHINLYDIVRYNIGYCETGEYKQRIIIPSYDETGKLNFFTGRSYIEDEPRKYSAPAISKNFIGFELFINWNLPIVLLEGGFDAIAYRRNAIPLFGKQIPNALKLKIIKHSVKNIYIGLDPDAIKDAIDYIEEFYNQGISVHLLKLDKDPSDTGYSKLMKITNDAAKIKFSDIMKLKLFTK